ncbi:protein of unknown function [Paraburkholderia kururiensis]
MPGGGSRGECVRTGAGLDRRQGALAGRRQIRPAEHVPGRAEAGRSGLQHVEACPGAPKRADNPGDLPQFTRLNSPASG